MTSAGILTQWARLLIRTLAAAGIREVVMSPGSRSTPLLAAVLEHPALCCHRLVDERSAGFFALAQGKLTGRPSLLLCTSGTAPAHYLPAVMEAAMSNTPLLVLSADRPFELHDGGAPQTTDQVRLFGAHARAFFDLGLPDARLEALRGLRRRTLRAVYTATFPQPGPVHLNFRAAQPLEPVPPRDDEERELSDAVDRLLAAGAPLASRPILAPDPAAIARIARDLQRAERGLLFCGAALPCSAPGVQSLRRLVSLTGFGLACELTSQCRIAPSTGFPLTARLELALRSPSFRSTCAPDVVLQIGAAPLSAGFQSLLQEHPRLVRHVLAEQPWPDPWGTARSLTFCDVSLALDALGTALAGFEPRAPNREWQTLLAGVDALADAVLAELATPPGGLSEALVCQLLVSAMEPGWVLVVGNSLPIRQVDLFAGGVPLGVDVLSQRGTNGIEGLVSGAAGAAALGRPTALLLGDISFLHDVGGLWATRGLAVPLVIVVINNRGGRIFEQLPVARHPDLGGPRLAFWTTPHELPLAAAAGLYGVLHEQAREPDGFRQKLARALCRPGCTILEALVDPSDARCSLELATAAFERAWIERVDPPQASS